MVAATATAPQDWLRARLSKEIGHVHSLLSARELPFDELLRSALPEQHGIYVITVANAEPGSFSVLAALRLRPAAYVSEFIRIISWVISRAICGRRWFKMVTVLTFAKRRTGFAVSVV